jgi:protein-tyrosine-phosphatase
VYGRIHEASRGRGAARALRGREQFLPQPDGRGHCEQFEPAGIFVQQRGTRSARRDLEHYHVIIALAKSAQKVFPPPPTKTVGLDWNVEDPSSRPGSLADVRDAYEQTFQYINTHVRELVQALVGEDSINKTKENK